MSIGFFAALAYGVFALIGGILAYSRVKSLPSLISGSISGLLLIAAAIAARAGQPWGLPLAAALVLALIVVFAVRWFKTRKFMPAGMMIIAGVLAAIAIVPELL